MSAEIYEALVVTGADPLGQGRAKVVIPQVSGDAVSTWALPTNRLGGPPPPAGSTVWVHLDTGDPSKPVYHSGALWTSWTAPPASWMGANFSVNSAAYRLGPGGQVQWRGAPSTTTSPLALNAVIMALPASLRPSWSAEPAVTASPSSGAHSAVTVQLDTSGNLTFTAAAFTFTGTLKINLTPLAYSTV